MGITLDYEYQMSTFGRIIYPFQGTIKRTEPKIGRNYPCQCGSGKKYKKCCIDKEVKNANRN